MHCSSLLRTAAGDTDLRSGYSRAIRYREHYLILGYVNAVAQNAQKYPRDLESACFMAASGKGPWQRTANALVVLWRLLLLLHIHNDDRDVVSGPAYYLCVHRIYRLVQA